jgi:hypothetical protein
MVYSESKHVNVFIAQQVRRLSLLQGDKLPASRLHIEIDYHISTRVLPIIRT